MNYIVAMTISGSSMMMLYSLQKFVLGERLSKRWQYFFLKTVKGDWKIKIDCEYRSNGV